VFLVVAHRCGRRPSLWAREKGEGLYSETADEGMLQAASMPYETASPCYAISASDASSLGGSSESGLCVRAHAGRLWTSWPPTWCALRVGGAAWLAARCLCNTSTAHKHVDADVFARERLATLRGVPHCDARTSTARGDKAAIDPGAAWHDRVVALQPGIAAFVHWQVVRDAEARCRRVSAC